MASPGCSSSQLPCNPLPLTAPGAGFEWCKRFLNLEAYTSRHAGQLQGLQVADYWMALWTGCISAHHVQVPASCLQSTATSAAYTENI
jgi:hypothetical protein